MTLPVPDTIGIDDPDLASMRVGFGWVCSVVDVGQVPVAVSAMIKYIDRQIDRKIAEEK